MNITEMKKLIEIQWNLTHMICMSLIICLLILVQGCKAYQGARQLAADLAENIKQQICIDPIKPAYPCGDRDVRGEADAGTAIYLYIYGVQNIAEIQSIVNSAVRFRDMRIKQIPLRITFYADLTKNNEIKHIEIRGN